MFNIFKYINFYIFAIHKIFNVILKELALIILSRTQHILNKQNYAIQDVYQIHTKLDFYSRPFIKIG